MKVRDLIERIRTAEFLSPNERIVWLKKMPEMQIQDLAALASVFDWLDEQNARMDREKKQIMSTFKLCLAGITNEAVKVAKKDATEKLETSLNEEESFNLENKLKDA